MDQPNGQCCKFLSVKDFKMNKSRFDSSRGILRWFLTAGSSTLVFCKKLFFISASTQRQHFRLKNQKLRAFIVSPKVRRPYKI